MDDKAIDKLAKAFTNTFDKLSTNDYSFNIYKLSERKSVYNAIYLDQYASVDKESFDSISELLDKYYYEKDQKDRITQRSQNMRHTISANLKRAKNKLQKQKEEMLESANREAYKVYADLISSNIHLSLIHISEPTRQAEISYAVFCLKKKKKKNTKTQYARHKQ